MRSVARKSWAELCDDCNEVMIRCIYVSRILVNNDGVWKGKAWETYFYLIIYYYEHISNCPMISSSVCVLRAVKSQQLKFLLGQQANCIDLQFYRWCVEHSKVSQPPIQSSTSHDIIPLLLCNPHILIGSILTNSQTTIPENPGRADTSNILANVAGSRPFA